MAITQTQIVDYLNKKVGYGVAKTDTSTAKYPFNESIASPLLVPGATVLQQDYAIPNVSSAPSANTVVNGTTVVSVYNTSTSAVVQGTSLSESISNETWSTGITNWIPPSFGSGYQLKVYAGPSGASAATAAQYTQLPVAGSGNSDSWFFDYQAGILNFADTNVPTAVSGNVVYFFGAVYTGSLGITNYANLNVTGNLTSTNGNIVLTNGNVIAQNYYGNGSYLTGVAGASSGNVSFYSQITPLSNNQTYYLEFANLTTGNSVTGAVTSVNVNPSTGTVSATAFSGTNGTLGGTLSVSGATTLTTATTGGLQAVAIGNVTPGTAVFTTQSTGGLQAVAIGNVTPGTAVFTTQSTGGLQAVAIGNVTPGSGAFTTGTFSSTLGVTGATTLTTATTGGLQAVAIGNVTPGTGAFTTGTFSSTLGVTGALTYTTATGGGLQAVAIGNVTPGTAVFTTATTGGLQAVAIGNVTPGLGFFTTANATNLYAATIGNVGAVITGTSGTFTQLNSTYSNSTNLASANAVITGGSVNGTPIGATTASSGVFTTLSATGVTQLTNSTQASSTTTGALQVTGGISTQANLYVGGNTTIIGNLTVVGTTTSVNSEIINQTEVVAGTLTANSSASSTSFTSGQALLVSGGAGIVGAAYIGGGVQNSPIGNATPNTGNFTTLNATTSITTATINAATLGNIGANHVGTGTYLTALNASNLSSGTVPSAQISGSYTGITQVGTLTGNTVVNNTLYAQGVYDNGTRVVSTSSGTGNLTISGSSIVLTATGPGATTVGSNTQVPVITTDAYGRIVALTSQTFSTSFTVGNTTGTTTSVAASSSLTLAGTYGVTVNIGNEYANIATPQDLRITANPTFNNLVTASVQGVIGNVTPASATFTTVTAQTESVGGLQAVAIGNVTPGTGVFTSLTSNAETVGGLQAVQIGNITPGGATFTTAQVNSTLGVTGVTTLTTANVGGLQVLAIGNAFPGTGAFTSLTGQTSTFGGLQAVQIGNVTPGTATFTTLSAGGLQAVAIGNITAGTGAFTTLSASGTVSFTSSTPNTGVNTGALQVTNGGAYIAGNLYVGGNINLSNTNTTNITGNSGSFYGNAAGFGALYTGISSGYTLQPQTVLQNSTNFNGYAQVNHQNINSGTNASTDYVATADSGTATAGYIDMGINSSGFVGGAGNELNYPLDGYLVSFGTTSSNGNLLLSTGTATDVVIATNGQGIANQQARFQNNVGLILYRTTTSTNTSTGALQVAGGAGIAGNLNVGTYNTTYNNIQGNLLIGYPGLSVAQTLANSTVVINQNQSNVLNSTSILHLSGNNGVTSKMTVDSFGANTASMIIARNANGTAAAPTASQTNNLLAGFIGRGYGTTGFLLNNAAQSTGMTIYAAQNFTDSAQASGITFSTTPLNSNIASPAMLIYPNGNVTVFGNANSLNSSNGALVVAGGVGIGGDIFTNGNLNLAKNLVVSGNTSIYSLSVTTANIVGLQAVAIGNITPGTGVFTSVTAQTEIVGGLQAVAIGNVTPGTGAFTTGTFSSTLGVTGATTLTTATTGGLQAVAIGNVTPGTGAFTTLSGGATTVSSLQASAIGNVSPGTGAFSSLNATTMTVTSGILYANAAIQSTSNITGALQIPNGGLGIANGNLYVGGTAVFGASLNYVPANAPIQVGYAINNYSQFAVQNASAGNNASTDIAAVANNGSDSDTYIDMGIVSSSYNQSAYNLYKPNDGYLIVAGNTTTGGGNLILNTYQANDIIFATGGTTTQFEVARITHGNTFVIKSGVNNSNSANTGALQVWGGASISGNVYHGGVTNTVMGGMIVNHSQGVAGTSNQNAFIAQGYNDSTLLYTKPTSSYDAVIVGGNGAGSSFASGAKLVINSTDTMLLPSGTNAQRPSQIGYSDTAGMFRYSTTSNSIEWYNGSTWQSATSSFTVVQDQQFSGTGSQVNFTLSQTATTNGIIVSINGIMQIPTLAYSVSGTTLTFTEAPQSTDVIDVRLITTTATVNQLYDSTGYNTVNTITGTGVTFTTGTTQATTQYTINTTGAIASTVPNVTISTANSATTVDSFFANTYSTAKYVVTSTLGTVKEATELLVISNGTVANIVVYGTINTAGNSLTSWSAVVSGGTVQLQGTTTNNNTVIRMTKQYNAI